jgi:mRNA interferase RelE/StbE
MAWKVELTPLAEKGLDKLDPQIARRILSFLHGHLAQLDDPRSLGEALKGSELGQFWKYRVGDYRIISSIEDEKLIIYVIRIGNRREIYRKI